MAGGGDRISGKVSTKEELLALFAGYKDRKTESAIFGEEDEDVAFLDVCLSCMDPAERDLVEKTCIENVSLRGYARLTGLSRQTVTALRNDVLQKLLRYFRRKNLRAPAS